MGKMGGNGQFLSAALQFPFKAGRWAFSVLPPSGFCLEGRLSPPLNLLTFIALLLALCLKTRLNLLTALPAGPPFSWGVTSGGPGGRSLSKDGTRADSAKDFAV